MRETWGSRDILLVEKGSCLDTTASRCVMTKAIEDVLGLGRELVQLVTGVVCADERHSIGDPSNDSEETNCAVCGCVSGVRLERSGW